MASIIKIPTEKSKGVVIFTTQDRDNFILGNKSEQIIEYLKKILFNGKIHVEKRSPCEKKTAEHRRIIHAVRRPVTPAYLLLQQARSHQIPRLSIRRE